MMTSPAIRYDGPMSAPIRLATAADLLALEGDRRAEIVSGAIVEKAAPSPEHSDAQTAVAAFTRRRFHRRAGGPDRPGGWWIMVEVDVELEAHELYRPDVVGWRRDTAPERPAGRPVRLRPDWVCEVLSPSNASNDLVTKLRVLHRAGVPHYWIVDPERQLLTVHRWEPAGYLLALTAGRGETVRAEPFDAVELPLGVLFGDEEE
jgi:Uma2 family endonuclease